MVIYFLFYKSTVEEMEEYAFRHPKLRILYRHSRVERLMRDGLLSYYSDDQIQQRRGTELKINLKRLQLHEYYGDVLFSISFGYPSIELAYLISLSHTTLLY